MAYGTTFYGGAPYSGAYLSGAPLVGQASETETAQLVTPKKTVLVGQVSETDTAQTVTRGGINAAVNQASETDTAQQVTWAPKIRAVGRAAETDTAGNVTRFQDTYASAVQADSPLLYWRLGESSGTTAVDSSGNGRTGTYIGTPTLGAEGGVFGGNTAVDFDGVDDHVAGSDSTITGLTAAWTIELWAKRQATVAAEQVLAAPQMTANTSIPWKLSITSSNQFRVGFFRFGGGGWFETDGGAATLDTWRHVVGTFDGSVMRLYVNGKLEATFTGLAGTPPVAGPTAVFYVARRWDALASPEYTNSAVDEFAVYNTALSGARIQAHYLAGLTVQQATETDTAQTVRAPLRIGQASETDTAMGADRAGFASEIDTAQAITVRKTRTVGEALETSTAATVTSRKRKTIGQATETDQALSRVNYTTWIDAQYDYGRDRDGLEAALSINPPIVPPPDDLAALAAPSTPTLTAVAGTGLTAGTYSYRVAAYRHDVSQITLPSPAAIITVSTPNLRVQVEWPPVPNASGYVVFAAPGASPADSAYQEVGRT